MQDGRQDRLRPPQAAGLRRGRARRRGGISRSAPAAPVARARTRCRESVERVGHLDTRAAGVPAARHRAAPCRPCVGELVVGARPGNRPGSGLRARRSAQRVAGRNLRSRRRTARSPARARRRARQRRRRPTANRRVDRSHDHAEAPLLGLHHDHATGNAGLFHRDGHDGPRRRTRVARRRLVRSACSVSE